MPISSQVQAPKNDAWRDRDRPRHPPWTRSDARRSSAPLRLAPVEVDPSPSTSDSAEIDLAPLLERYLARLTAGALAPRDIYLVLRMDAVPLDGPRAWRLVMILTSVVEAILRAGFDDRGGLILVEASAIGGELVCCISDNGGRACAAPSERVDPMVRRLVVEIGATLLQRGTTRGGVTLLRLPLAWRRPA